MTTAQIALSIVMIVASLFLIVVVLLQSGAQQGLGAISGGAETFSVQARRRQRIKFLPV